MPLGAAAFWFCLPFLYIEAIGQIQSCHSATLSWAAVEICWANKGIQQNPAKSPSVLAAWQWIACEKQAGWCFQKHSAVDLSRLSHGWMQKPNTQTEEGQRLSHLPWRAPSIQHSIAGVWYCPTLEPFPWGSRGEDRGFGYVRKKKISNVVSSSEALGKSLKTYWKYFLLFLRFPQLSGWHSEDLKV